MKLEREILENIFITALSGGSNYWMEISNETMFQVRKKVPKSEEQCYDAAIFKAVYDKKLVIDIHDAEDEDEVLGQLDASKFDEQIEKLLVDHDYGSYLFAEIEYMGDAESSDVVFQYLIFGDVVYG
jgi:hypothetical protein